MAGRLVTLLTKNHGELARFVFGTSVMTGFVYTIAAGHPMVDPFRWKSGDETAGEGPTASIAWSGLPASKR